MVSKFKEYAAIPAKVALYINTERGLCRFFYAFNHNSRLNIFFSNRFEVNIIYCNKKMNLKVAFLDHLHPLAPELIKAKLLASAISV